MRLSIILILTQLFVILPGYGIGYYLNDNGLVSAISATDPPENDPPELGHSLMVWHWEDAFNSAEREKIELWIQKVNEAAEKTLGIYPFEVVMQYGAFCISASFIFTVFHNIYK